MVKMSENFDKKLEELAEDSEEKLEDVKALFSVVKIHIQNITPYELTEPQLNKQAYEAIKEHYNAEKYQKAREQWFIPFGISSEAQDQNEELREEILKEFSNPELRLDCIRKKKVMVMKISDEEPDGETIFFEDVYQPVTNPDSIKTTTVNDEVVVIDGDLWNPGDVPIPRDYKHQTEYGDELYDNKQYSKPLYPKWKIELFGIGFFSGMKEVIVEQEKIEKQKNLIDDGLITRITFYGDLADPKSPKFICKKPIWFNVCKLKSIDTNYSNELFLKTYSTNTLEIMPEKLNLLDYLKNRKRVKGIITLINERVAGFAKKVDDIHSKANEENTPKEKLEKLKQLYSLCKKYIKLPYIPVIDLNQIDYYHLSHRALKDKDNKIVKDEKGVWDNTDFNSFALCQCSFSSVFQKDKTKPPKMVITDATLPQDQSLFLKFSNGLDTELPASSVIISLTTSRGNSVYDPDTKKWITDAENAKAIAKIKGMKLLIDYTKLNIGKLKADL